jgi:hypothetical protein
VARVTDAPQLLADGLMNLTEVLCRSGPCDEGLLVAREALVSYEQKGNIVSVAKARRLLEDLNSKTSGALS